MRHAVRVALVLLLVTAAATVPARAQAGTPCWKQVINDWYDNSQLDHTYPVHCYREALNHLPTDLQDYSPIGDDINAAMLAAIRAHGKHGGGAGGNDQAPGKDKGASQGLIARILGAFGANGDHKIPLPLVILGLVVAALAGAAAYPRVARRLKERPRLRAAAPSDR
jgi:hypothetical protein